MKKILSPILIFSISLLLISHTFQNKKNPEPTKAAMEIISETSNLLASKYNMIPCGNGINMDEKIEYLSIEFHVFRPLTKDKARAMLFDCIDAFLENINSNESIKSHLNNYPFIQKNVGVVFYITEKNYKYLYPPHICVAQCSPSGVYFMTNDPENKFQYKETYEETHEEALALVKKYREEHPQ